MNAYDYAVDGLVLNAKVTLQLRIANRADD